MTDTNQKQLDRTLWSIADQLHRPMNADDFRDTMLSFLFLRYLSDNDEPTAGFDSRARHKGARLHRLCPSPEEALAL